MNPILAAYIEGIDFDNISHERKELLEGLAEKVNIDERNGLPINLNFICTHNSRRSQFAQVWAATMSNYYYLDVNCYSGGIEVTACNERTITALEMNGFLVEKEGKGNPRYSVSFDESMEPVQLFSKLYSDAQNPSEFFAIMTCDHADQNCPIIPKARSRYALTYTDPKKYDDTVEEEIEYLKTSAIIATEMKFLFSIIEAHEHIVIV
jgi:arsenate reductase (thioredoxin)